VEFLRTHALALPVLVKFAIAMAVIVVVPTLSRRYRLPGVVGLLLSGVVLGPHVLGMFGENHPIADFFAELGKLLLMFFAGLEINVELFRQARTKAVIFGVVTCGIPLLLGAAVGLRFGNGPTAAIALGSLLASHTLLGYPIVEKLGATRLEPVTVTVGATVLSDILSLVVFAICVPIHETGFSPSGLTMQLVEIAVVVPFILFGVSRAGAYALRRIEDDEDAYFILMLGLLAVAAMLAESIDLPGIVGAFLAGLAVNAAVREHPAKKKLEFFGNSFFIPIFFIVTGFLIDPLIFARSIVDNFFEVAAIILALVAGKWLAAEVVGRAFAYSAPARLTMWSLTLPQVAATLAAAIVAFHTLNAAGQPLLDRETLNAILVLMLTTAILGPVLTQRFAPRMIEQASDPNGRP